MNRLVTDAELDKALAFLRDSAAALGAAKERTIMAGHKLKHIEALEFKMSDAKSQDGKKADARTSTLYIEAITEDAVAAGEFEKLKALREAAAMKVQAWQTESANFRSMKV